MALALFGYAFSWREGVPLKRIEKDVVKAFVMVTQIGISMVASIGLAIVIGISLDRWLSTDYWVLVMALVGILAGFRSVYYLTKGFYSKELDKENEETQYIEGLKREGREGGGRNARGRDEK